MFIIPNRAALSRDGAAFLGGEGFSPTRLRIIRYPRQIVHADMVKPCQDISRLDTWVSLPALIAGIRLLRDAQQLRQGPLGNSMVFSQFPQTFMHNASSFFVILLTPILSTIAQLAFGVKKVSLLFFRVVS
jgi:hypothetical protein